MNSIYALMAMVILGMGAASAANPQLMSSTPFSPTLSADFLGALNAGEVQMYAQGVASPACITACWTQYGHGQHAPFPDVTHGNADVQNCVAENCLE